ncbi:MAG: hypothetical protein QOE59_3376 [Actinomycetota bacterium]|nr:hypothetical protein [Actinomycetota bacterium]
MVSTVIRRVGVVGAMTLAGAGVAAGSAFAAVDTSGLPMLQDDLPAGSPTSTVPDPGKIVRSVPVVGKTLDPIVGNLLGSGQHRRSYTPRRSQPSRHWDPPRHSEPIRHVDCGCHPAPKPVHHCPPAPHHCPPPAPHHHHKHHQHHHHNHHQQHHHHHR